MADIFEINLPNEFYDKVVSGKANYIVVLNDNKVKSFKEQNVLTLVNEHKQQTRAVISRMLQFDNIKDVISMLGKMKCGFGCRTNEDKIEDLYISLFSQEKILKFGLVAIEVNIK